MIEDNNCSINNSCADVSVIIPCYNSASIIERAVASVWQQTRKPIEVILVDDCSSDGGSTLQVLYKLRDRYPEQWVKVIPVPVNKGPGNARNTGWDIARGKYVAFLDADDSWHPQKIEIQYAWMNEHPQVDLSGHLYRQVEDSYRPSVITNKYKERRINTGQLLFSNYIYTRSVMLKNDIPQRFDYSKRHAEDYLLWLKIAFEGSLIWRLEIPLAFTYKPYYEGDGLSSNLWAMEKGELDTYKQIHTLGYLNTIKFVIYSTFSLAKYLRRLIITLISRLKKQRAGNTTQHL